MLQLAKNGASVELVEYEGGHGWHGEVMDRVTAGLNWLQE
ncbi:hypothetical protein Fuma_01080 [Fuerstiella marisgermanici]|uniref:Uncharacterized protein n=1 Tax=Fuerstiella marisgermanici TaxID=1891926 RepID=A0A1P8WBQ1_9PLAN|nr:hypothetical protein Fuma_01080 [Fuerstiella marisgermanici]